MADQQGSQLGKTARHSAIYAVGTFLRRITGFVMLPIYTRFLTPSDYGAVELLVMMVTIAGILIGLRISQAMFRYYILEEDEHQRKVIVSTVLLTAVFASVVGATVICLDARPLARLIFGNTEYVFELQLFALTLVTNAVTEVGINYLRARQKPLLFLGLDIIKLVLQIGLNILFVVILEWHVRGVAYSTLIAGLAMATVFFIYLIGNVGIHYSKAVTIKLIKFIAPLVIASIGLFYVGYADKYFLRYFGSLADVGLYALAAKTGTLMLAAFEAFNMSWAADRYEIVKRENAREVYEQVFRFFSAGVFMIGAGLALFAGDFFHLMTTPEYYPASSIVPILVLATAANIFTIFCNFGALYHERTRIVAEASWLKAVVATAGYLSLIIYFGVYGAAIALAAANAVGLIWTYRQSTKLYDMGLKWRPVGLMFGAAAGCVLIGFLIPEAGLQYLAARVVLFAVFMISIYLMPIWKDGEKETIRLIFVRSAQKARKTITRLISLDHAESRL